MSTELEGTVGLILVPKNWKHWEYRPVGKCGFLKQLREAPGWGVLGGGDLGAPDLAGSSGLQGKVKWPIGPRLEAPGRWAPLSWLPGYLFSFVLP